MDEIIKEKRFAILTTPVEIITETDTITLVKSIDGKSFTVPINDKNFIETGDMGSISLNVFSSGKLNISMTDTTTVQALIYSLVALIRKSAEELKVTPEEIVKYIQETNVNTTAKS